MEFIIQNALKNTDNGQDDNNLEVGQANIKVIGAGGAGNNVASWLYKKGISGAEVIVANTDKQHLDVSSADRKILIGRDLTRGLGAGGFLDVGRESAKDLTRNIIQQATFG